MTMDTSAPKPRYKAPTLHNALSFWLSLVTVPLVLLGAAYGGWTLILVPIFGYVIVGVLDRLTGLNKTNRDPLTADDRLFWYRLITLIWAPVQIALILTCLAVVAWTDHLAPWEQVGLFVALGIVTGTVGINYAHELIHQKNRLERILGEVLLISVLYGHFRTEHILVHHRYVGTPRDPVTARFGEGFPGFFARVLWQQVASAWMVEAQRLHQKGKPVWHLSNPFWRYWGGAALCLLIAYLIAGPAGIGFYVLQALIAVMHLELVNYLEHYGLTRRHLGEGRYEHVQPRHSWNAAHRISNYLLINLQRHSDHHYKPDRRFPLLQTYTEDDAPQLPAGYPLMVVLAMVPPLWRRVMDPRVRAWRDRHYPDIEDWAPYESLALPRPR